MRRGGFTLIELLTAIAIIGCLAGLLVPSITALQQKANTIKCASNMRQIGVSAQLYINDHGNRTPVIEPWPANPIYSSSDNVETILQALGAYGVTKEILQCPGDLRGPNYYAKEGSSYQWFPMANGQNTQAIKQVWMGNNGTITMSRLFLAFDYSAVHNGNSNVLFGDGHVESGN